MEHRVFRPGGLKTNHSSTLNLCNYFWSNLFILHAISKHVLQRFSPLAVSSFWSDFSASVFIPSFVRDLFWLIILHKCSDEAILFFSRAQWFSIKSWYQRFNLECFNEHALPSVHFNEEHRKAWVNRELMKLITRGGFVENFPLFFWLWSFFSSTDSEKRTLNVALIGDLTGSGDTLSVHNYINDRNLTKISLQLEAFPLNGTSFEDISKRFCSKVLDSNVTVIILQTKRDKMACFVEHLASYFKIPVISSGKAAPPLSAKVRKQKGTIDFKFPDSVAFSSQKKMSWARNEKNTNVFHRKHKMHFEKEKWWIR